MPTKVEIDGKSVEVYLPEEHEKLVADARKEGEATTKAKAEAEAATAAAKDDLQTKEQARACYGTSTCRQSVVGGSEPSRNPTS